MWIEFIDKKKCFRQKRDIDATLAEFQESFNQDMDGSTNPNGNIYLRSFGQDVFYTAFDSLNDLAGQFTSLWPFSLANSLSSRQNIEYDHSSIFLDGKIVIPTIAGLPLSLAVNGSSILKVQTDNHFDFGNLFQTGDASLQIKIYPTASLQISGEMSVDAVLTKTALKSLSTLHTSTFIDGQVQVEKGQLVKAEINVPREKMEILEVAINYYTLKDNTYQEVTSPNQVLLSILLRKLNFLSRNKFRDFFYFKFFVLFEIYIFLVSGCELLWMYSQRIQSNCGHATLRKYYFLRQSSRYF